jgi:hypothetical protein
MSMEAEALAMAAAARTRLQQRQLLAHGLFSVRIPGSMALAAALPEGEPQILSFKEAEADPLAALHVQAYRHRRDAGAVASGCPPWGAALASLARTMPVVFDEQARHLGPSVLPLDGPASLAPPRNAYFLSAGCLCLGTTPDRAVFNAELLEKCAHAYLLAILAGGRVKRIPFLIRLIAGSRLRRDQRIAAAALATGAFAQTATAY